MKTVKIEKYIGKNFESRFSVPVFVFRLGNSLLPGTLIKRLADGGIDLEEMLAAKRQDRPYLRVVEVNEHGVDKRIVVSLP